MNDSQRKSWGNKTESTYADRYSGRALGERGAAWSSCLHGADSPASTPPVLLFPYRKAREDKAFSCPCCKAGRNNIYYYNYSISTRPEHRLGAQHTLRLSLIGKSCHAMGHLGSACCQSSRGPFRTSWCLLHPGHCLLPSCSLLREERNEWWPPKHVCTLLPRTCEGHLIWKKGLCR